MMNNKNIINLSYDKFTSYEEVAKDFYKKKIDIAIVELRDDKDNIYKILYLSSKIDKFIENNYNKNYLKQLLHNNADYFTLFNVEHRIFRDNFYYFIYKLNEYSNIEKFIDELFKEINFSKQLNIVHCNVIGWSIDV